MTDEKEEKKEPVQDPAKVEVPKAQDTPVEPEVVPAAPTVRRPARMD